MLTIELTERCVAITRQGRQCLFKAVDEDGRCVHHTSNVKRRMLRELRALTTMANNARNYLARMEEMYPDRDHSRSVVRLANLEIELAMAQEAYEQVDDDMTIWDAA